MKPVGGGGPELLVVKLVVPPCVTCAKVKVTGVVPPVESMGWAWILLPTCVLLETVGVAVGVCVGVDVNVGVGVGVRVKVGVKVAVLVGLGVTVGVEV